MRRNKDINKDIKSFPASLRNNRVSGAAPSLAAGFLGGGGAERNEEISLLFKKIKSEARTGCPFALAEKL